MEKNLQDSIEQDLHDYIENLKKKTLGAPEIKTAILRIKRNLDYLFDCYESDIADGDISKEELLKDYLEQYRQDIKPQPNYQSLLASLSTDYDACKRIIKLEKKDKITFDSLMKEAKQKEHENSKETLTHSINLNNETLTVLRLAIRYTKYNKSLQGPDRNPSLKREDILSSVLAMKNKVLNQIKDHIGSSLRKMAFFLDDFGYLDENIEKTNELLKKVGLSGLEHVKSNPFAAEEYDGHGNRINPEEFEDMGVLDFFRKENVQKTSLEDLLMLDLYWKTQYFSARLDISEALSVIDFLDLWPTLLEEDESAIEKIDDEKLDIALKRDLALTYLIRNKQAMTPELEKRYVKFLESNGMSQKGTTYEEIANQSREIEGCFAISDDILLAECVILDKLINGELGAKNWGIMDKKYFKDMDQSDYDKMIFGIEMPSFRGPLMLGIKKECIYEFLQQKGTTSKKRNPTFPEYKGVYDEDYSYVMATLLLPTSTYFKKFVIEKYKENPTSPLYEQLATSFAGGKKIKHKNVDVQGGEEK